MVPSTKEVLDKYSSKIESELGTSKNSSQDYNQFKRDMIPKLTKYEKWANSLGNIINIKASEKDRIKISRALEISHLNVSPSQALTLSLISMLALFFLSILSSVALYLINPDSLSNILLFSFLGLITSIFIFYYTYSLPTRLANEWRLKASSQMIPAILYTVVYMKHTSNLEKAIQFASEHLEGPLALDFKKIFYNVEIGKFSSIKSSIDNYLETWRDYSPEFIESFHLIESSLFEPSESRRVQILEKSLQVILDGVYEKMLKYSREIRSPLTNVYMLGIILPTLGLALLPLASTLLGGIFRWQHVFLIFNIIIPLGVFYLTSEVLLKRPGGYGETSVLELNPDYQKFASRRPWLIASLIAIPLIAIGLLPFILASHDTTFTQIGLKIFGDLKLFDFKSTDSGKVGPFGVLSVLLSLFIPLGVALLFSITYKLKTKELIKARDATGKLEEEFTNSLFQLGNRIGDGLPAEIAFGKVAESTTGQASSKFFSFVNHNIQNAGMSLEKAVFNKQRGAITYYPSSLIATSMKILIESVKKGLQIAARSLMSISEYVKNIQKINQRLRDLLAEIVSDMKSNMVFLAPLLAGIIVGLSSMITIILTKLQSFANISGTTDSLGGFGSISSITSIFDVTKMIPPYFTQISVGIYLVEIIFILTAALVTVDSGKDLLREKNDLSKNLIRGITLYLITALLSILILISIAIFSLSGLTG
jgi:Flp pilus assembly protein TadB